MRNAIDSPVVPSSSVDRLKCLDGAALCDLLGISRVTLWRKAKGASPIPSVRIGSRVLYPLRRVEEWLARQVDLQTARAVNVRPGRRTAGSR